MVSCTEAVPLCTGCIRSLTLLTVMTIRSSMASKTSTEGSSLDLYLKSEQEKVIRSTIVANNSTVFRKRFNDADPLPVYWINLEESIDRRHAMETMFSLIDDWGNNFVRPVRLVAVDIRQVLEMLEEETLWIDAGTKLVPRDDGEAA